MALGVVGEVVGEVVGVEAMAPAGCKALEALLGAAAREGTRAASGRAVAVLVEVDVRAAMPAMVPAGGRTAMAGHGGRTIVGGRFLVVFL